MTKILNDCTEISDNLEKDQKPTSDTIKSWKLAQTCAWQLQQSEKLPPRCKNVTQDPNKAM